MNVARNTRLVASLLFLLPALAAAGAAREMNGEIDRLISSVGREGCVFVRNGKRFSGAEARAHLKSKRRRNAHLIDSTEEFIEKIASRSVTTGQPYRISCRGKREQNAGEWLTARLLEHRSSR